MKVESETESHDRRIDTFSLDNINLFSVSNPINFKSSADSLISSEMEFTLNSNGLSLPSKNSVEKMLVTPVFNIQEKLSIPIDPLVFNP